MYRAIQDYLCIGRCEWMQKWPGMCVLNASQLHWTAETEELLIEKAGDAPAAMLTRQVFVEFCLTIHSTIICVLATPTETAATEAKRAA